MTEGYHVHRTAGTQGHRSSIIFRIRSQSRFTMPLSTSVRLEQRCGFVASGLRLRSLLEGLPHLPHRRRADAPAVQELRYGRDTRGSLRRRSRSFSCHEQQGGLHVGRHMGEPEPGAHRLRCEGVQKFAKTLIGER